MGQWVLRHDHLGDKSGVTYVHMYTADDERIWTFQAGAPSRWTLRDLDGKVLRAAAWDAVSALAPTGGSELINWMFLPQ